MRISTWGVVMNQGKTIKIRGSEKSINLCRGAIKLSNMHSLVVIKDLTRTYQILMPCNKGKTWLLSCCIIHISYTNSNLLIRRQLYLYICVAKFLDSRRQIDIAIPWKLLRYISYKLLMILFPQFSSSKKSEENITSISWPNNRGNTVQTGTW